jgi:hypothetical protein
MHVYTDTNNTLIHIFLLQKTIIIFDVYML